MSTHLIFYIYNFLKSAKFITGDNKAKKKALNIFEKKAEFVEI